MGVEYINGQTVLMGGLAQIIADMFKRQYVSSITYDQLVHMLCGGYRLSEDPNGIVPETVTKAIDDLIAFGLLERRLAGKLVWKGQLSEDDE